MNFQELKASRDSKTKHQNKMARKYTKRLDSVPPLSWVVSTLRGYKGVSVGSLGGDCYEITYYLDGTKDKAMVYVRRDTPNDLCVRINDNPSRYFEEILLEIRVQILGEYNGLATFANNLDNLEIVSG